MANPIFKNISLPISTLVFVFLLLPIFSNAFIPYTRSHIWDLMVPTEDPFRVLEQTPLTIPIQKGVESVALARADWKETQKAHIITLDIPGIKKDEVKIEVEENRVLKISGERKVEDEIEGERWHRAERTNGKFWRQFRLPNNADLDHVNAHLQDGVLKITVPKFSEEQRIQPKVINIVDHASSSGQDIKPTKANM
ncbi:18.1 kDa class I heat shock protein-like [Euphorbia lathyris]|uniref:18.1 kDa class I heat shock protein-like n=1 Tax=Euphorbia lathyris TaxID=212925 RepID=UPI0033140707